MTRPSADDDALLALEREAASDPNWMKHNDLDATDELEAEMAKEEARIQQMLMRHQQGNIDVDEDFVDDPDAHGIKDDDVLGELDELERQVHGHGGSGGHGGHGDDAMELDNPSLPDDDLDADALLADAEDEAARLVAKESEAMAAMKAATKSSNTNFSKPQPPPRPQPTPPARPPKPALPHQQLTAATTTLAANITAPPVPSTSSASVESLPELQSKLLELKTKAVELNRNGKKSEALDVMRHIKALQGRIQELQFKPVSTPSAHPQVTIQPTSNDHLAAPTTTHASSVSATPVSVASPSSTGSSNSSKLSIRSQLEYETLIKQLDGQITSLTASMKTLVSEGSGGGIKPGSKEAKLLALQYFRAKQRSVKDRDLLLLAKERALKPPQTHHEELLIQHELSFPHLSDDVLEVVVTCGRDLHNSKVISNPNDMAAIAAVQLEYAIDMDGNIKNTSLQYTPVVKGCNPAWSHTFKLPLPYSRAAGSKDSKLNIKKLLRSKVIVQVHHKRFLLGAAEIGRGDIRLKEMSLKSELVTIVKLKDSASNRCGEVDVTIRMHRPFEGIDLRQTKQMILVVDEFEEDAMQQHTESAPPPQQQQQQQQQQQPQHQLQPLQPQHHQPAPATTTVQPIAPVPASANVPSSASTTVPSSSSSSSTIGPSSAPPPASSSLPSDPHSIGKLRSNDILEHEITRLGQLLVQLRNSPIPKDDIDEDGQSRRALKIDETEEKLTAAKIQLEVIVTMVQNGKLTLQDYLQHLRADIVSESQLALQLARAGMKADAALVVERVKIMKTEVANAEENMEELEQC